MKYVVDAHALIWFLANSPLLGKDAGRILSDPASELVLPATALAEVCWIVERKSTGLSVSDVLTALDRDPRLVVYPLDRDVIEKSNALHSINEMHDRQIAATAVVLAEAGHAVSIITADANITQSGVVPVSW